MKMCCVEWFAQDAQFLTMQKLRSVKVLVRCLELLRPELTTSSHHITEESKNFIRRVEWEIFRVAKV